MTLYLLPNLLGAVNNPAAFLPMSVNEVVPTLNGLIAESEKEGRAYLKLFGVKPQNFPIKLLNEHTPLNEIETLLTPILKGEKWGVVSDCGLPCLADPGSQLVLKAKAQNINVIALVGPSSIVLALMLSGLSGQKFAFHGYISREEGERKKELKLWEKRAREEKATQVFMEAPYRNDAIFETALSHLEEKTLFCVASDLTLPTQSVITASISEWRKKEKPSLNKRPTLFLIG